MKMAKASIADLDMAIELSHALESLERYQLFPDALQPDGDELRSFDIDNHEHCKQALNYIFELVHSASLFRVTFGMTVMLDPANKLVDPNADTLEHHPDTIAALKELGRLTPAYE
jgi:hypothetical protein